jgi:hypothetical protein
MGPRNLGHRLHPFHVQDPQIGLPALELEQRIVIRTKPRGQSVARDGLVNMRQSPGPLTAMACTPKPMIRRVN